LAHEEHGTLPWADLFDDAVDLAEHGFPMPDRFHQTLRRLSSFREDPATAIFFDEDGAPLAVGEKVTNAEYASTLRRLASDGAALFYSGAIADAIIARVNGKTGEETMRKSDFLAYEPMRRKPLCKEFEGSTVCSMPPPSSGGVTLLQIMTMFKERAGRQVPADAVLAYLEATRLAYADRGRFLGDPEAMGTEVFSSDALTKALISQPYLQGRAMLIGKAPASTVEPGNPSGSYMIREGRADGVAYEVPSTSHFSIRDGAGNVVSMTTTVEMPFGSQMMVAGMVLNNQLTDFSRVPGDGDKPAANAPGPGKRPMSSMTPVIVLDSEGVPSVVMGSPGGPAIIGYVAKPLLTHLLSDITLADAIREHHLVVPRGSVIVENGGNDLKAKAEALGYEVKEQRLTSGIYGFSLRSGALDLAIDPRREGTALAGDEITTATAVAQP
ncbi:MAG: gamma-glutamyltransferase, partial [Pseudomonadota bacterium]